MQQTDPAKAYLLLESGPVVLVTTEGDPPNVMTVGFHMVMQHAPPLIGCIIGPWDHTHTALIRTGECVIAVPTVDLAKKIVDIGNCSGADIDKFAKFRLTAKPAKRVKAPLIAECLANLECTVVEHLARYNMFVLQPRTIWIDRQRKERRMIHHRGDGTFSVDGRVIDLRARMTLWKEFQVTL